jgi:DNA-binding protein H-NS
MDLNTLSLEELQQLRTDVEKAIATVEIRRKKEAYDAVRAAAAQFGMSLDDLIGEQPTKGKGKSKTVGVPKYAHPENPDLTWTGRGRRPKWVEEHEAAGGSLDDLAI